MGKLAPSPQLVFGDSRGQAVNTPANVMNGPPFNIVIGSLTGLCFIVTVSFRLSPPRCLTIRVGSTIAVFPLLHT